MLMANQWNIGAMALGSSNASTASFFKEAINVIPAVVGASLVGIDKSDQYGYNWPLLCEEYFNRRPAENPAKTIHLQFLQFF
jgi:hypothetical protein